MTPLTCKILPALLTYKTFFVCAFLLTCQAVLHTQTLVSALPVSLPSATEKTLLQELDFTINPALLAQIDSSVINLTATPARFGVKELTYGRLLAAYHSSSLVYACSLSGLGNSLYNEYSATAFCAMLVSPICRLGGGMEYTRLGIRNAEPQSALQFHLGAELLLTDQLSAGCTLRNITRAHYTHGELLTDQRALMTLGYTVLPEVNIDGSVLIVLQQVSSFIFSASTDIIPVVRLRIGIQTPGSAMLGISYTGKSYSVTSYIHYHSILGISEEISLAYRW